MSLQALNSCPTSATLSQQSEMKELLPDPVTPIRAINISDGLSKLKSLQSGIHRRFTVQTFHRGSPVPQSMGSTGCSQQDSAGRLLAVSKDIRPNS